jgi:hypothetical protein
MPYIGRPQATGPYLKLDDISDEFDGSKVTFNITLGGSPFFTSNAYTLLLSLDGVIQEPIKSFIVNENQLTFASAPTATSSFYCVVLGTTLNTSALTSLTIGRRSGATSLALNGEQLGVKLRDGTKGFISFNVA